MVRFGWFVVFAGLAGLAMAAQPVPFNYQVKLTDSGGSPLSGAHNIVFTLFKDGSTTDSGSGTPVYSEQQSFNISNGLVNHTVGTGDLLSGELTEDTLRSSSNLLLEVQVDGGGAVLPRLKIQSVPYATIASTADQTNRSAQIAEDFPVATGQTIAAGNAVSLIGGEVQMGYTDSLTTSPEFPFINLGSNPANARALSSTQFVVTCSVGGIQSAVVGTISGQTISYGSVASAPNGTGNALDLLTPSKFVLAYKDLANTGSVVIGNISGNSISFATPQAFSGTFATGVTVVGLDATKFVIMWRDSNNGNRPYAVVGLVTGGDVIAFGPKLLLKDIAMGSTWGTRLSSSSLVAMFNDNVAGIAEVATVSGLNITTGTEAVTPVQLDNSSQHASLATLSSNSFVAASVDGFNSGFGTSFIGTVSGGTITFGPTRVFNHGQTGPVSITARSSNQIAIGYSDTVHGLNGIGVFGDVSGTNINFGTPVVFRANGNTPGVCAMTPQQVAVAYGLGTSSMCLLLNESRGKPDGIAGAAGVAGDTIPVIVGGFSNVQSGLSPGVTYYANPDGSLTGADSTLPKVGKATKSTQLLLQME